MEHSGNGHVEASEQFQVKKEEEIDDELFFSFRTPKSEGEIYDSEESDGESDGAMARELEAVRGKGAESDGVEEVTGYDAQIGGAYVKVTEPRFGKPQGRFRKNFSNVSLDVRLSRNLTRDPACAERLADAIVEIVKKHVPQKMIGKADTRAGVVIDADEFDGDVGLPITPFDKMKSATILKSLKNMSQSNKNILKLDNPKSKSEKSKICKFLAEQRASGAVFNFREEVKKYCHNDVFILASAMTAFEKEFEEVTDVCLLEESTTAASAAVLAFRRNHLKRENPIVLDPHPNKRGSYSEISQKYLTWLARELDVEMFISTAHGEKKIRNHRVDGFVEPCAKFENGAVFEFNGCYHHAHECMYTDESTIHGLSAKEIRARDAARLEEIKEEYPEVQVVWECEVKEMLTRDSEMKKWFENWAPVDILKSEKALVGGRTEVFKLYAENEGQVLRYLDVNSLYPTVMKHESFPIGPPETVWREEFEVPITRPDQIKFNGLISGRFEAPGDLELPLLPIKTTKLVFGLCYKCVANESQEPCTHDSEERSFNGTYTTVEVKKALSLGYKVTFVYHAVKWEEWIANGKNGKGGLFTSYINQMLEEKIYSSGWPANVKTDDEKKIYCDGYMEKERISLDKWERFSKNPGKRQTAKLMLNSLWGKFAQRIDKENTVIVKDPGEFWKMYHDTATIITQIRTVNDTLVVKYRVKAEEQKSLNTSAMQLAVFTTSYARLKLYSFMERVGGKNIIYTDTDSIIYGIPEGEEDPLEEFIGPYLGQLADELTGTMERFVTIGPKSYCYTELLKDGTQKVTRKAKGITLNSRVDDRLTFELMEKMVREVMANSPERTTTTLPQFTMKRDDFHRVFSKDTMKTFRYTFSKRRVLADGSTLPFGFI